MCVLGFLFPLIPLESAREQPRGCAEATTESSECGMLFGHDWASIPEFHDCPAKDSWPHHHLRSPKMLETTWQDLYRAAILELDHSLLKVRLKIAEDAINARASDSSTSCEERREMADAISTLQRLMKIDR
jgi:hypothetical protein